MNSRFHEGQVKGALEVGTSGRRGGDLPTPFRAEGPRGRLALELALLLGAMALLGAVVVPAHWTSLWMDREFTGWVAPVANRMHGGVVLYGRHGHLPMPPGPFVLVELLSRGRATWLTESLLNFAFQSLAVLAAYAGMARLWRPPVPFLAAFATLPIFYALPKTILYDASAQFLVALTGVVALWYLAGAARARLPALGVSSAACLLFKQSTGAGLCLGVALAVLLATPLPWRRRLVHLLAYGTFTGLAFAILTLLLTPWIDPTGMIQDVFFDGSEAKGGGRQIAKNLATYAYEAGQFTACFTVVAVLLISLFDCRPTNDEPAPRPAAPPAAVGFPLWLGYLGAVLVPVVLLLSACAARRILNLCLHLERAGAVVLWFGLLTALLLTAKALWPGRLAFVRGGQASRLLAGLVLVFLLAAVGHTLSVWWFRWSYDNNPLLPLVLGVMFATVLRGLPAGPGFSGRRAVLQLGVCLALQGLAWSFFAGQLTACLQCTEAWPEVTHLRGARLNPSAAGVRQLVEVVRQAAREHDKVLLLPNDPNVEAWFERRPPQLSSVILFADQYLDRRVEGDLEALRRDPPRVIVLGPKNFWRAFHRNWKQGYGAERLIDRVQQEVLPAGYELHATVAISHNRKKDEVEVYVRKAAAPAGGGVAE
jgi:hypothetical protein